MKRANPRPKIQGRQRRRRGKHDRRPDYATLPTVSGDPVDAMSADSFPASDPPGFIVMLLGRRNAAT